MWADGCTQVFQYPTQGKKVRFSTGGVTWYVDMSWGKQGRSQGEGRVILALTCVQHLKGDKAARLLTSYRSKHSTMKQNDMKVLFRKNSL